MLQNIRHVCFDKDGTLIDVHKYWNYTCGLRADWIVKRHHLDPNMRKGILDAMGIDMDTGRIKKGGPVGYFSRGTVVESVSKYLRSHSVEVTEDQINELFSELDRHQQKSSDYCVEMIAGVPDFLEFLRKKNIVMSIYSSDRRENSLRLLERLSLAPFFTAVVGGGCVKKPKPDPEGFLLACDQVGVSPEFSAYIGDSLEDLKMAHSGNAACAIGVATGIHSFGELRSGTQNVVETLDAVRS